jgi:hypothetical protein
MTTKDKKAFAAGWAALVGFELMMTYFIFFYDQGSK